MNRYFLKLVPNKPSCPLELEKVPALPLLGFSNRLAVAVVAAAVLQLPDEAIRITAGDPFFQLPTVHHKQ